MSAAPVKVCPKCKKTGVKRLIGGGAGLIFKGTGFYINDYKKSPGKKEGGEGGGASKAPAGDAKTSSGGDAKASPGGDALAPTGSPPSAPKAPA